MDGEKLRFQIGANIAAYRKQANLTQAGLANQLNYSDKAVSKWERGDSVPDVLTLVQLAELFGVSVNDLLSDPNALSEQTGPIQQVMGLVVEKTLKRKANKSIILGLSSILVWFIALLVWVVLSSCRVPNSWIAFIYAIPVDAIVLLSLRSAWHDFRRNRALISVIMWGAIASLHLTLLVYGHWNIWRLYLLGIPGQAAIFLWFMLFRPKKTKQTEVPEETHG